MAKPNELLKDNSKPDENPERQSVASRLRIGLTPIPPTLMHWWTPILVAAILFSLSLTFSMFWGDTNKLNELLHLSIIPCLAVAILPLLVHQGRKRFRSQGSPQTKNRPSKKVCETNFFTAALYILPLIAVTIVTCGIYIAVQNGAHWPSKDAMFLCTMICTAGSAFSTWQQRSYENQLRAEQEEQNRLSHQDEIMRDEYWRRREQAYQLLTDPSPNIRLAAISLLIELADTMRVDGLLQQHILDTLCRQIRHEGYKLPNEGTKDEHAHIQSAIFNAIIYRLRPQTEGSIHANWTTKRIDLSRTFILCPLRIEEIELEGEVDFTDSTFSQTVILYRSKLQNLQWKHSRFLCTLDVEQTTIVCHSFPDRMRRATFSRSEFFHTKGSESPLKLPFGSHTLEHEEPDFIAFKDECRFYSGLQVHGLENRPSRKVCTPHVTVSNCTVKEIILEDIYINSPIRFESCKNMHTISMSDIKYHSPTSSKPSWGRPRIAITDCRFVRNGSDDTSPSYIGIDEIIDLNKSANEDISTLFYIHGNKVTINGELMTLDAEWKEVAFIWKAKKYDQKGTLDQTEINSIDLQEAREDEMRADNPYPPDLEELLQLMSDARVIHEED